MQLQTLKGFRDFLPSQMKKRKYILNILTKVFESYGFEPLETPTLEYEEILAGKYGEEGDKLMYRFTDNGKRRVAIRYDQTVPLARVVAQYANDLPFPFKRYQIQNVYRADNTQKGRFREFLQVDIDTVGSSSALSDAEIIKLVIDSYQKLGFKNFKVLINDRKSFEGLENKAITIIDKLEKIGVEKVRQELMANKFSPDLLIDLTNKKPTELLNECFQILKSIGVNENLIEFSPTLARGLDYYTGLIFEVQSQDYAAGSLGGGGRYDNLIGMFSSQSIPAVGFAFGFDRILEAMELLDLFPGKIEQTKALVTYTSPESPKVASFLREKGIKTFLFTDEKDLDKQLRFADKKRIPYAIIVNEANILLKDMITGEQKETSLEELPDAIR